MIAVKHARAQTLLAVLEKSITPSPILASPIRDTEHYQPDNSSLCNLVYMASGRLIYMASRSRIQNQLH